MELTKEALVDLFSTATYGSEWLEIKTLKSEKVLDDIYSDEYKSQRCLEEKWADRLLNGGHIVCLDWYDEDYDNDGNVIEFKIYKLTLEDIKKGLNKARNDKDMARTYWVWRNEEGDYYTANNLIQYILFGEVVYG